MKNSNDVVEIDLIQSPIQKDYVRKVELDEFDEEHVTFVEFDYPKYQKSLGSVKNWSLDALVKAGIDPAFPIHTGFGTRIEGLDAVDTFSKMADQILDENVENKE